MKHEFLICPLCHAELDRKSEDVLVCPQHQLEFPKIDGIWRFLLPEREAFYQDFIRDYETIRQAEGRGANDPVYYRSLPFNDLSGRLSSDWAIRARSFIAFKEKVFSPLERELKRPLKIADLGAGNGWLSNRLAARGHLVVAVDLLVNQQDGLGAWKHYERPFVPVQAEFNYLPIRDEFVDLAIFNASIHYSEDYQDTLNRVLRVVSNQGVLAVLDSPIYHSRASGEMMVKERQEQFIQRYGFASNALNSENFLTYERLDQLGKHLNIRWSYIRPFYGLRWWLRPLKAFLLGQREPAKFHIITGSRCRSQK